jgi:hypothetical protein
MPVRCALECPASRVSGLACTRPGRVRHGWAASGRPVYARDPKKKTEKSAPTHISPGRLMNANRFDGSKKKI